MIPLRDNIRCERFPSVNYGLIAVTTLVFAAQLVQGPRERQLVEKYGMIPARVLEPDRDILVRDLVSARGIFGTRLVQIERPAEKPPFPAWLTLLSCIFLHGGWLHFLGNMWFLHIFGDNVEDRFGSVGYLVFYLLSGIAASAVHLLSSPSSEIPTIGASGAIAGVMGAYFLLYPRALVLTLVPIFFFIQILVLPAVLFLGVWFLIQFFQGTFSITSTQSGGVAWWAHIGGFVAGLAVAYLLRKSGMLRKKTTVTRPGADRLSHYRYRVR